MNGLRRPLLSGAATAVLLTSGVGVASVGLLASPAAAAVPTDDGDCAAGILMGGVCCVVSSVTDGTADDGTDPVATDDPSTPADCVSADPTDTPTPPDPTDTATSDPDPTDTSGSGSTTGDSSGGSTTSGGSTGTSGTVNSSGSSTGTGTSAGSSGSGTSSTSGSSGSSSGKSDSSSHTSGKSSTRSSKSNPKAGPVTEAVALPNIPMLSLPASVLRAASPSKGSVPLIAPSAVPTPSAITTTPPAESPAVLTSGPVEPRDDNSRGLPTLIAVLLVVGTSAGLIRVTLSRPPSAG